MTLQEPPVNTWISYFVICWESFRKLETTWQWIIFQRKIWKKLQCSKCLLASNEISLENTSSNLSVIYKAIQLHWKMLLFCFSIDFCLFILLFFQKVASYFDDSMWVAPSGVVLVVMFVWLSTAVSPPPYSTARTSMCIVSILFPMNEALNVSTPDQKSTNEMVTDIPLQGYGDMTTIHYKQWRIQYFPEGAPTDSFGQFTRKLHEKVGPRRRMTGVYQLCICSIISQLFSIVMENVKSKLTLPSPFQSHVSKKTLWIRISLCIRIRFWMVSEGLPRSSILT